MFWALVISPFVLLVIAVLVTRKGALFRTALVLIAIFAVIDAFAFWQLTSVSASSTGSIGLGVLGLIQCVIALIVAIASPFARKPTGANKN
jgi:hypothetical protein